MEWTQNNLNVIATALYNRGYHGIAADILDILWWKRNHDRGQLPMHIRKIMSAPLKDMPLYISHKVEYIQKIAAIRIKEEI